MTRGYSFDHQGVDDSALLETDLQTDPERKFSHLTKQEANRRLLQAARNHFIQQGYATASLREIARQAGATTGAIYSHFKGKIELFQAAFEPEISAFDEVFHREVNLLHERVELWQAKLRGASDLSDEALLEPHIETHLEMVKLFYDHRQAYECILFGATGSGIDLVASRGRALKAKHGGYPSMIHYRQVFGEAPDERQSYLMHFIESQSVHGVLYVFRTLEHWEQARPIMKNALTLYWTLFLNLLKTGKVEI